MAMMTTRAVLLVLAVVAVSSLPTLATENNCVYTIYVRTGSIWRGGTESTISVEFYDTKYNSIFISNLTLWGGNLFAPDHQYFERGALDIFSGLGDCLENPICGLNLTSNGEGDGHGWYVNYVEVTFTGAHLNCSQHLFTVERWLASDTYPFSLVYDADECSDANSLPVKQCVNTDSGRRIAAR